MSDTINDPAQIEAAFERDQEAEDSRPAPLLDACACFPGTCRGGEVINGRTAGGMRCRRSDTKAERDKVDERLALGLLRAEYGERAGYLAGRLEEIAGRFRGAEPMPTELREAAKLLRCLLIG